MFNCHLHLYLFCLFFLNLQQLWNDSNLLLCMRDVVDMSLVLHPLCLLPILTWRLLLLHHPSRPPNWYGFFSPVSLVATLSTISIPSCYKQAMEHECWQIAMQAELQALEENHTWDIVPCPPTVKPSGSKWVFSVKLRSDGSLDRVQSSPCSSG